MDPIYFRKTSEPFGWLHNMCGGYRIHVGGEYWKSSEALYQALRFPGSPDVQRAILEASNGFTAKLAAKKHVGRTRADWGEVRVPLMEWVLRLKFGQHEGLRQSLVEKTGDAEIVELSHKDRFWGRVARGGEFEGENVLGQLLMSVRAMAPPINQTLPFPVTILGTTLST
jgi:type I restriction enzyme, S subunit